MDVEFEDFVFFWFSAELIVTVESFCSITIFFPLSISEMSNLLVNSPFIFSTSFSSISLLFSLSCDKKFYFTQTTRSLNYTIIIFTFLSLNYFKRIFHWTYYFAMKIFYFWFYWNIIWTFLETLISKFILLIWIFCAIFYTLFFYWC